MSQTFKQFRSVYMIKNRNKLIFGVGVNDAKYEVVVGSWRCPFYDKWHDMLKRAYSTHLHSKRPTYINVEVCKTWHIFSNFKKWMIKQDWDDKDLDKDIIYPNNKIYSPKTCCFITSKLNTLIHSNSKKGLPTGVYFRKDNGKFRAIVNKDGKNISLGQYTTVNEARCKYLTVKIEIVKTYYPTVKKRIRKGLKRHIKCMQTELGYV